MAEPYLTELRNLASTCPSLKRFTEILSYKHFFSGAAAYFEKQIFLSISPVGLSLKLSNEDCLELLALGGTALQYFPKAPIKKGYVVVPPEILKDEKKLNSWIARSIAFVQRPSTSVKSTT